MSCIAPTAFWLAVFGTTCFMFGFVLPCWLGRHDDDGTITIWGLWYRMDCGRGNCSARFEVLDGDAVPYMDDWVLELTMIPALATVAVIVCHVGMTLLELLTCRCCCRSNCNPHRLIIVVAFCFILAGVFSVLTLIMVAIVYDDFYAENSINHAEEFPWSALLYGVGAVLVVTAGVLYLVITCDWHKHSDYFGYQKPWYSDDNADGPIAAGSMYRYNRTDSFKDRDAVDKRRSGSSAFKTRLKDSTRGSRHSRTNGDSLKRRNKDEHASFKRSSKMSSLERSQSRDESPPQTPTGFVNSAYSTDSLDRSGYFDFRIPNRDSGSFFKRSDSEMNIDHRRSKGSMYSSQKQMTRSMTDLSAVDLTNSRKDRIDNILQSIRDVRELRESKLSNSSKLRDSDSHELREFRNSGKADKSPTESGKHKFDQILRSVRKLRGSKNTDRLRSSKGSNYSTDDLRRSERDFSAFGGDSNIQLRSSTSELSSRRETREVKRPRNPTVLDILARESM